MANLNERKYEIYDADASFTESTSMIADYSVIERRRWKKHAATNR
jgi:hypothetical protein